MKKLALAIGLAAYAFLGSSTSSLAAYRADNASGVGAIRDSRIAWSVTGTNARLLFLNEALYPETTVAGAAVTAAQLEHRKGERVSTDTSTTFTDSQLTYRRGERSGSALPDTTSADTQRMFCEGDICIVP